MFVLPNLFPLTEGHTQREGGRGRGGRAGKCPKTLFLYKL